MGRDDEQKWQSNTVGPYRVLRRLKGAAVAQVGRVYAVVRSSNGRPGLLVAPNAPGHYVSASPWRLRAEASVDPAFLALEVDRAPGTSQPVVELAEALDALTSAVEGLEGHPAMASHLASARRPRSRRAQLKARALFIGALAATLVGLLLLVTRGADQREQSQVSPDAMGAIAPEALLEAPQALPVLSMDGRDRRRGLGLEMPRKPFPGQYVPDKDGKCKGRAERAIHGGCWIGLLDVQPPCENDGYEHKGKCYLPSIPSEKEPSSTAPRRTIPPALGK